MMNESLDGRVALVTGGGRGIGQAIAAGLAAAGARVAVVARSTSEVRQVVELINKDGGAGLAVPADITNPAQMNDALAKVGDNWGPVELLVNNAGAVWPLGASATLDPQEWTEALAVNVTAAALLSFAVLPRMLDQGWGRIVNVSSGAVANPSSMLRANAYITSKTALEAHTLNLAAELDGSGVTVNVFRPGGVDTAMQAFIRAQDPERIGAELHQRFTNNHEQGTLLTPERSAASLLAHLHSKDSGQIWDANNPLPTESEKL